jgi:2-octaprenyl-6-methoxyphenol hydroxylase
VQEFDVAIVGGGMVGASCALALAGSGRSVVLIEGIAPDSAAQPSFDERTTALGNASRRIFEGLGIWEHLAPQAAAIRAIHVSEAGRFGFARLNAAAQGIDAFGYVVANRVIGAALWKALGNASGVSARVPARPQSVVIAPDAVTLVIVDAAGAREELQGARGRGGGRRAFHRACGGGHRCQRRGLRTGCARCECAGRSSPRRHRIRALRKRWTACRAAAATTAASPSYGPWRRSTRRVFSASVMRRFSELQACFGWRAGCFVRAGRRASYALKLTRAAASVALRTALIGNAAQALHPVAGQGFNLGLRDAAMLAELIAADDGDPGAAALLQQFAAWRASDRSGVIRFTDGLIKIFGDTRAQRCGAAQPRALAV